VGGILKDIALGGLARLPRSALATGANAAAKASAHGLDWGAVIAQAAIWASIVGGVAAAIAIMPMTRKAVLRVWRGLLMWAGLPHQHYARQFVRVWGIYRNPYLNKDEPLDLQSTYVPLLVRQRGGHRERRRGQQVRQASDVLAEVPHRMVIVGDPGSGKSTLLAAHGVSMLYGHGPTTRRRQAVPYLIQLRDLATFVATGRERVSGENIIADYVIREVLDTGGFFKSRAKAAEFFLHTVAAGQAVVMLDGLDEVSDDKLDAVLGAVDDFMNDGSAEHPTRKAKVWLTCRTQNFEILRGDWIDTRFAPYDLYSLEPLRDSDIIRYLNKFSYLQRFSTAKRAPRTFATAEGPGHFMAAIREDDKIDLLRAPLILAMAVGLYAERPAEIPSTIDKLYQEMIIEMLNRHRFPYDRPGPRPVDYKTAEKYSLLQQFALQAAKESGNFDDFTKQRVVDYCEQLKDTLDLRGKPGAFVDEIILHSSLLSDVHHSGLFHFAHRSIQEFLAAQELRTLPDEQFLLDRATDLNWRQTIQFYTAGQEARRVDAFLRELAGVNPMLAVRCLKAARSSGQAARVVLDAMPLDSTDSVGALAAATHSPQPTVQEQAIERLEVAVMATDGLFSATDVSIDGMLPLLRSLASTNAAKIATMVPRVASALPDDTRLVGPLWQCLRADGMEDPNHRQACSEIVARLLTLVIRQDAFEELAAEDPGDRRFLAGLRGPAYPFRRGLPPDHNLVTLLAWAEYLHVLPAGLNRFFAAKAAGKLGGVEAARRTTVKVCLCWPARVIATALLLTALGFAIAGLVTHPGWALHPFGWWTLGLMFGTGVAPLVFVYVQTTLGIGVDLSWEKSGNPLFAIAEGDIEELVDELLEGPFDGEVFWIILLAFVVVPAAFALAPAALAGSSLAVYIALSICGQLLFWESDLELFEHGRFLYPHRPNEFVDMYENPTSKYWVARPRDAQPASTLLAR
jgi:hypothetical protein